MKSGAIQAARDGFFPLDRHAEKPRKHLGLKLRDDGIRAEQIEDRRVMLDDAEPAIFVGLALAHVAIVIAHTREPFRAVREAAVAQAPCVVRLHFLKEEEEKQTPAARRRGETACASPVTPPTFAPFFQTDACSSHSALYVH